MSIEESIARKLRDYRRLKESTYKVSEEALQNWHEDEEEIEQETDLDEAEFEFNDKSYFSAFGKYMMDGKPISREEYMKASDAWKKAGSPKDPEPPSKGKHLRMTHPTIYKEEFSEEVPEEETDDLDEAATEQLLANTAKVILNNYKNMSSRIRTLMGGSGYYAQYSMRSNRSVDERVEANKKISHLQHQINSLMDEIEKLVD